MRQIDIAVQTDRLRTLADRFDALRRQLLDGQPLTGTEGLRQLIPHVTTSHELVTESLIRLAVLDGSQAARISGAQAAFDCVSSVVEQAGLASASLTSAICDNTYDANSWAPQPADDTTARNLRHREARQNIATHLAAAAQSLSVCATGCRYVATHLSGTTPAPPVTAPVRSTTRTGGSAPATRPVRLTPRQHQALHTIAQGGVKLHETTRGRWHVATPPGPGERITLTTYNSLEKKGLVDRDTSSSLFTGQALTATDRARTVLAALPPPAATPPAQPGPPPATAPRR
ncbi:hypothetical protein [Streptomyces sp. NPDC056244]|uniref:hypothetical protein n=1 Tax=Streptomyces sp. NPDC056244 TaxID=3345762 RepID=UPI0035E00D11